eukprot:3174639-Ditylum_brightwellii.AAC.1
MEANAEVFAKHFSKVFNNLDPVPCNDSALPLVLQCEEFAFLGTQPVYEEVRTAIMRMANVWCEADPTQAGLNADAEYLCQYITDVLKLFWEGELNVKAWKTGNLSPGPKPGDLSDPNKWQPVCLLKTLSK